MPACSLTTLLNTDVYQLFIFLQKNKTQMPLMLLYFSSRVEPHGACEPIW